MAQVSRARSEFPEAGSSRIEGGANLATTLCMPKPSVAALSEAFGQGLNKLSASEQA